MTLCSHVDGMSLALVKLLTFLVIGLSQVPRLFSNHCADHHGNKATIAILESTVFCFVFSFKISIPGILFLLGRLC